MQLNQKSGRKKRAATTAVMNFMDSIKAELGDAAFDTFMSVNGDVTLMFAIDDTGSMRDEIQAAKDIAIAIVNKQRDEKVDYILSPFNDPGKKWRLRLLSSQNIHEIFRTSLVAITKPLAYYNYTSSHASVKLNC